MKNFIISLIAVLSISILPALAQDTTGNSSSFDIPVRGYGISFGNSTQFSGLRFNFADRHVVETNGINITFWLKLYQNQEAVVNGLSLGIIPTGGSLQPINIGLLGVGAHHNLYGLNLTGGVLGASGNISGLSICGLFVFAEKSVGVTIAGLSAGAKRCIKGVVVSGFAIGTEGNIRGAAFTCGYLGAGRFSGVAVGGYTNIRQMNGISIALYNHAKELHGVQIGILNVAENNCGWCRWLPLMNMNFRN